MSTWTNSSGLQVTFFRRFIDEWWHCVPQPIQVWCCVCTKLCFKRLLLRRVRRASKGQKSSLINEAILKKKKRKKHSVAMSINTAVCVTADTSKMCVCTKFCLKMFYISLSLGAFFCLFTDMRTMIQQKRSYLFYLSKAPWIAKIFFHC